VTYWASKSMNRGCYTIAWAIIPENASQLSRLRGLFRNASSTFSGRTCARRRAHVGPEAQAGRHGKLPVQVPAADVPRSQGRPALRAGHADGVPAEVGAALADAFQVSLGATARATLANVSFTETDRQICTRAHH
jgi:hypothetical protein